MEWNVLVHSRLVRRVDSADEFNSAAELEREKETGSREETEVRMI